MSAAGVCSAVALRCLPLALLTHKGPRRLAHFAPHLEPACWCEPVCCSQDHQLGIDKISYGVIPFLLTYMIVIVVISLFPQILTVLPDALYGKP